MATTRLIPMHKIKNQSVAYTVHERIGPMSILWTQKVESLFCLF